MGLITWKSSLETGHAKIDEQHRTLAEALNALHRAMRKERERDELGRILDTLRSATIEHFQTEEELMDRFGYPGLIEHKGLHGHLVSKMSELCRRHEEGRTDLTLPVTDFLEGWLTEHIRAEDLRLAEFLKSRGNVA